MAYLPDVPTSPNEQFITCVAVVTYNKKLNYFHSILVANNYYPKPSMANITILHCTLLLVDMLTRKPLL